jgi:hypothetical protein
MLEEHRCRQCGDLIGVYEPLILLTNGQAQETSRAARPGGVEGSQSFHRRCFQELPEPDRAQPLRADVERQ